MYLVCLDMYFGCLDIYSKCLDLYFWCLDLYLGVWTCLLGVWICLLGAWICLLGGNVDGPQTLFTTFLQSKKAHEDHPKIRVNSAMDFGHQSVLIPRLKYPPPSKPERKVETAGQISGLTWNFVTVGVQGFPISRFWPTFTDFRG